MENIVINFDANTSELTKAIDLLVKLGQVDQKTADEFKRANAAYAERKVVTDQAAKSSANLGKTISETGKQSEKAFDGAKNNLNSFDSALKKIGSTIAAAFAVEKIIAFGAESVKAFQEAEKNALLLKSAVSVNGGLQQDFEDLIKQSEELQKITIFSDDTIQQAQTAALQFGLTKNQVEKLLPVIADFASATGQDLQTALDGVLQGVNGMGRGLKMYGVSIDETQSKTERLGDITDQLTKKFDGQAEAVGKTAFGAAEKYKNELDDLQEKIGKDLAPTLNSLQISLLKTAKAFYTVSGGVGNLSVELGKLVSESGNIAAAISERLSKAFTIDPNSFDKNFNKLKDIFKGKFDTSSIEDLRKKYGELAEAQKTLEGNQLTLALAKKAAIIELLAEKSKDATSSTNEEADAISKLANISKLSDKELQQLLKTLDKFNSLSSSDAKDKINKEIELRAKAKGKAVDDKKSEISALNALEKQASDNLIMVKAAEVDKVAELEAKKQLEIKKIQDAFAAAGSPASELEDVKKAIDDVSAAFDILIKKEQDAQAEIKIKINAENVKQDFEDFKKNLEDASTQSEIKIKLKFIQAGDFSEEAFKKLQADIEANSENTYKTLIEQAEKFGIDKATIDDLVLQHNKENADKQVQDAEQAEAAKVEAAKKSAEERMAIEQGVVDFARGVIDLISQATNNYYNAQLDRIEENKQKVLKAYENEAKANEELHQHNMRGDRQYEKEKEKIEAQRKRAEERADKEKRKILHDQAVLNKELAIANAIINTAVAVTANLAVPVVAALIAVLGAAEVAVIASQPIPGYAKGKERIEGKGTETSDEIPAMLSRGERVVKSSTNRKYFPILSAIHHERFDPEAMNQLARFSPETIKQLSKVDPLLIHDLATMRPVFMKHINMMPEIRFRNDITPVLQARHDRTHIVSRETDTMAGMNEWDITRALDRGTKIKNEKELAKSIGKEVAANLDTEYSIRRRI